ncbi:cobalamin binding intrinsic factor-like [Anneissia japonica]|uniref:cobalamin binding intrinsic factor-like n=1 Tax=Anneissia japonica TaxID=1529436 RepID=UPI0014255201|nr:cobalamin binding intrinsic factor-like [Anneissia japonica]
MSSEVILLLLISSTTFVASDVSQICGEATPTALAEKLQDSIDRGSLWLEAQQQLDGSWPLSSTKETIWALQMANENWYRLEETTRQLGVKQIEIEILAQLAHNNKANHLWSGRIQNRKLSLGKFAYYVNALNATCHDVTNFYGHNLVEMLQEQMHLFPRNGFNNYYQYALAMLAVCNSGQTIKVRNVRTLISGQDEDGIIGSHSGLPDETAMAVMALHCVLRSVNHNIRTIVSHAISDAEHALLSWQQEDGSFGNIHSTALVVQALTSSTKYTPKQWYCNDTMRSLLAGQDNSGSFGSLGATVSVLPALAGQHFGRLKYLDLSCKQNVEMSVPSRPTNSSITFNLTIQDEVVDENDPITIALTAPQNTSLYGFMSLAAESDQETFSFEFGESSWGLFIKAINGLYINGDKNHYWLLLDHTGKLTQTGMDNIYPEDGDHYVWTYRALL